MNADPADIAALAVVEVEPAEAQPVLGRVELGDLLAVHGAERLALGPGRWRAAGLPQHPGQPARGALTQVIEAAVEHRYVVLLEVDVLV